MWKKPEDDRQILDPTLDAGAAEHKPFTRPGSGVARQPASIGPSITIRGDISGEEDLLVQGAVEGSINLAKNDIVVGAEGKVKANLRALNITVDGVVAGDLNASERILIKKTGKVEGNIAAPRVVLEDGCRFKGSVEMSSEAGADAAKRSTLSTPARKSDDAKDKVSPLPSGESKAASPAGAAR
jgi:cytoskeletal protein CcmA (bactofilin family)